MNNMEFKKAVKKIVKKAEWGRVYATINHLNNNEIIIKFGITKEYYKQINHGKECPFDSIAERKAFTEKYLPEIEALGCKGINDIANGQVYIRLHIGK